MVPWHSESPCISAMPSFIVKWHQLSGRPALALYPHDPPRLASIPFLEKVIVCGGRCRINKPMPAWASELDSLPDSHSLFIPFIYPMNYFTGASRWQAITADPMVVLHHVSSSSTRSYSRISSTSPGSSRASKRPFCGIASKSTSRPFIKQPLCRSVPHPRRIAHPSGEFLGLRSRASRVIPGG